jgi:hypothetical protein
MSEPMIPTVCIHGALRSRLGMLPAAWYFARHGLRARTFGYRTRAGTIAAHARELDARLRRWLVPDPPAVLGFFTHSMGGLVARAWLQRFFRPQPADPSSPWSATEVRLVMLSPPNRGSQLARSFHPNPAFRWLYGDAATLLAAPIEAIARELGDIPPKVRVLILAGGTSGRGYNRRIDGDDDGVVALADMGLAGIEPQVVTGVHSWLQWRPELLRRAARFLRTGEDAADRRT